MPEATRHRRRRHRSPDQFLPAVEAAPPTPWLAAATDLGLLAALWLVTLCLGGRLALGQGVLILAATWSAACWALHQVTTRESRWIRTRSEWLWLAGVAILLLQTIELPEDWLEWLSPYLPQILPEWSDAHEGEPMGRRWATVSLNPAETRSSLATFVAYAMLFVVGVQRLREQRDIERVVRWIAIIAVAMAIFSLGQFAFGNGKFYGVLQHPFSEPRLYPLGPFTNRNHLAQFLALGVGPLMWWWIASTRRDSNEARSGFAALPMQNPIVLHAIFAVALGVIAVTVLLSQSRGGVLALGIAGLVSLWGFQRAKLMSAHFVSALFIAAAVIGAAAWFSGSHELAQRLDSTGPEARWQIWQANIDVLRHFPWLGTGAGTHVYANQLFLDRLYTRREFTHADNSYLQVASECGIAGIIVAALMLIFCLGWAGGVLRRQTEPKLTALATAVFASLMANVVHAAFDFLWFVPALAVVLILLAAAARRLSQIDLAACGSTTPELPLPRICWGMAGCGIIALAPWLWAQKADAIASEPEKLRFLNLVFVPEKVFPLDEQPESVAALQEEKAKAAIRAARLNRRDAHLQLNAALAYRELFDRFQERGETPMTLAQLRDAALASGFNAEEMREWIGRVSGKNMRLLNAAWNCARRSINEAPLEGGAYVCLAELSFLHDLTGNLQERLLTQALAARPHDPVVLFAAGQEELLLGRDDRAMQHWKRAFRYGPVFQTQIADILAVEKSADFFFETFSPDWQAQWRICDAYRKIGRTDELHAMQRQFAKAAVEEARQQNDEPASVAAWLAARDAWQELEQPRRAIDTLREAVKQHPHSLELRSAFGIDLFRQDRYVEAAEHLRWASARKPDDAGLKSVAEQAVRASLNSAAMSERVTPAGFAPR